jgi:hypothetical protein
MIVFLQEVRMPGIQKGKTHRSGAGRPLLLDAPLVRVTVTLPSEYVEWAREVGKRGNVSAGLRSLLDELDQRQGADLDTLQAWPLS